MTTEAGKTQEESLPAGKDTAKTSAESESGSDVAKLMGEIEVAVADDQKSEAGSQKSEEETEDAGTKADDEVEVESKKSEDENEDEDEAEDEKPPEDADAIKEGEIKGLPAEVQERINRKIGKSVARRKQAEERAEAAEATLAEAKARIAEFESRSTEDLGRNMTKLGLHESYLSKDEAKLLTEVEELREAEDFCLQHFDGYEASGEGDDKTSYDAKQVRARYAQVRRQLEEKSPRATALRAERAKLLREDLELGRAVRLGKRKLVPEAGKTEAVGKKTIKPPPVPASATPKPKQPGKTVALTQKEVLEAPDTKDAMAELIARAL